MVAVGVGWGVKGGWDAVYKEVTAMLDFSWTLQHLVNADAWHDFCGVTVPSEGLDHNRFPMMSFPGLR